MTQILLISGPTATGKTDLAIKLAQKFNGRLISADSRQIYRGMDIGTGKDHPKDIDIALIDIKNPDESFSVAEYRTLALQQIALALEQGKLPIIVGGTGQYIDAIINPQDTFHIPPNNFLRSILNRLPLKYLQTTLRLLDPKTFNLLNHSDSSNPHRLIRKIEIKIYQILNHQSSSPLSSKRGPGGDFAFSPVLSKKGVGGRFNYLHLSLTAPNHFLYYRIDKRVTKRLELGLLDEIKSLLSNYHWSDPGLNCLGYKQFKNYFQGLEPLEKSISRWQYSEHALARRQKTWFHKIPQVKFIDITRDNYGEQVTKLVSKWYNQS